MDWNSETCLLQVDEESDFVSNLHSKISEVTMGIVGQMMCLCCSSKEIPKQSTTAQLLWPAC